MNTKHPLGFFYRPDTNDATSVYDDVRQYSCMRFRPEDIVLDLGGHIGLFALHCFKEGVHRVVSVEPDPDNCGIHALNLAGNVAHTLIRAACVGDDRKLVQLYCNPGRNKAYNTVAPRADWLDCCVSAVNFDELLASVRPTVLKVDVEGAEHSYSWKLPSCVRLVAVELHWNDVSREDAFIVRDRIEAQGFEEIASFTNGQRPYSLRILERRR